jgi:hypothetical protein
VPAPIAEAVAEARAVTPRPAPSGWQPAQPSTRANPAAAAAPLPDIHITIDRVEVRLPQSAAAPRQAARPGPGATPLKELLRRRTEQP